MFMNIHIFVETCIEVTRYLRMTSNEVMLNLTFENLVTPARLYVFPVHCLQGDMRSPLLGHDSGSCSLQQTDISVSQSARKFL